MFRVRRPLWLPVVIAALLPGAVGCGNGDATPSGAPEEVVAAYVEALDQKAGNRFCELVAPYIRGRYDLAVTDPDAQLGPELKDCGKFLSAFIGYVDDGGIPRFTGAELLEVVKTERRGEVVGVHVRLRVQREENGERRTEPLRDVVWLARFDDAWRVAKISALAREASLNTPRFSFERQLPDDEDPAAPPDIAAEERAYAAARADYEANLDEREASYESPGDLRDCSGGISVTDPVGDQQWNGSGPGEPPDMAASDLAGVDLVVDGRDICVRWRIADEWAPPLAVSYSHGGGSSGGYVEGFDVEIRDDRTARVTAGDDDDGRPIVVPAELGASGNAISMVIDAQSFEAAQVNFAQPATPELDRFTFIAGAYASAGDGNSVQDQLPPYLYPDGRKCEVSSPGCR